jgi:hypothetical protein
VLSVLPPKMEKVSMNMKVEPATPLTRATGRAKPI